MAFGFRFIHEKSSGTGASERRVVDLQQREVIFGRGGASHVLLSSHKVGTEHAKFFWDGEKLLVADLASPTGVRVNGRLVSRAELHDGDTVLLGDVELTLRLDGSIAELTWLEAPQASIPDAERIASAVGKLRVDSYLPSIRALSIVLVALGTVAWLAYPLGTSSKRQWSSGPISSQHKLIENDCVKCHAEPFKPVRDQECQACHSMSEHAQGYSTFVSQHAGLEMRCAQCHMEHNGDHALISRDQRFCTSCHAEMSKLKPGADIEDVSSFDQHPQFRIEVRDALGAVTKVSLDDSSRAKDSSQIKLNHKLHLKQGLEGKDGPVTLECSACHQLDENFKQLKPIEFDKHCRDCHSLGFDERLPEAEVPHGDSEAVFPALFAAYSRVVLLGEDQSLPNPARDMERDKPGDLDPEPAQIEGSGVSAVVENAREAERQLFTRTGCFLCHSYKEKPELLQTSTNSHYEVLKPGVPNVWFTAARFSHGAHEEFTCESCHEKTRESTQTSELLLPGKKMCQDCHASGRRQGYVSSDCVECHSYHDSLGFPHEKKQDIASYIKGLTR